MKGFLLAGCAAALLASSPVLAASSDHSVTHPTTQSVAALDDNVDPALLKMRVDQLKGKDIHGSDGKDMAEIEDIVRYNRQLFAVIDVDHTVDVSDRDVVLPLNKLRVKGGQLTLDMTKEQLQGLEKWQKDRYERVKETVSLSELGLSELGR